jgi:hypothetical protein
VSDGKQTCCGGCQPTSTFGRSAVPASIFSKSLLAVRRLKM